MPASAAHAQRAPRAPINHPAVKLARFAYNHFVSEYLRAQIAIQVIHCGPVVKNGSGSVLVCGWGLKSDLVLIEMLLFLFRAADLVLKEPIYP